MSRLCLAKGWPHVLQGWVGTASLIEEIVSAEKKAVLCGNAGTNGLTLFLVGRPPAAEDGLIEWMIYRHG
jgi:hypothetical protein